MTKEREVGAGKGKDTQIEGDELRWSEGQWEDVMGMWRSLRWMKKNPRRGGLKAHFCTSTERGSIE